MPRLSTRDFPPLKLVSSETIGHRLARIRKARGYTQVDLAEKIGIVQNLVSDYERDKLRLHAEMVVRFAQALEVTSDELLGLSTVKSKQTKKDKVPLRLLRRLKKLEQLPAAKQKSILHTFDLLIKGVQGLRS